MGITDLDEQFIFYASYHQSTVNRLIHTACVWQVLWSAMVFLEYIPLELPLPTGGVHPPNVTFVAAVFYAGVYIVMDKRVGSLAALFIFGYLIAARWFYLGAEASFGMPAWQLAAGLHVLCWIALLIGHEVFEGRSPPLLDNVLPAIMMAPLFVLMDELFFLGYRQDFQKMMRRLVEKEVAKFEVVNAAAIKKDKK